MHPLDLENFGWTAGGIVQVDGGKLNEAKLVSNMLSTYMHVDSPAAAPQQTPENGNGNTEVASSQTPYHNHNTLTLLF